MEKCSLAKLSLARAGTSRLKRILYLGWCVGAGFTLIVSLTAVNAAQRGQRRNRPEIAPQEKPPKKKITGEPRAVGLLRLTDKGKATLVPIAILIDGKFYDASEYKASPVPMALESGTVYEGERTGSSLGLFTVSGALQSRDPSAATPWIGAGQWVPEGAEPKKKGHRAEDMPVGLENTDEPPRLTRSSNSSKDTSAASTPAQPGTASASTNSTPSAKPADASQPSQSTPAATGGRPNQTAPAQTAPAKNNPDGSKPTTPEAAKTDQAAPAPGEDTNSQADANRPKLRRGKPTAPLPDDEDVPGYSKVADAKANAPATATEAANTTPKSTQEAAVTIPPQLVPAISDEAGPDPRSYVFEWGKSEEEDRRKDVVTLAQQELHAYLQAEAKNSISAKTTTTKAGATKAGAAKTRPRAHKAAKAEDLVLEDLQIRPFDLWGNNQPVIVLTAKAHPALAPVGIAGADKPVPEYWITLVARTDIYNDLHKLFVGVTDKYHLDVTPKLELIDAVDADGDGRGELLFRETSDAGTGYIIYRATGDTLWKMFDSLNPE